MSNIHYLAAILVSGGYTQTTGAQSPERQAVHLTVSQPASQSQLGLLRARWMDCVVFTRRESSVSGVIEINLCNNPRLINYVNNSNTTGDQTIYN